MELIDEIFHNFNFLAFKVIVNLHFFNGVDICALGLTVGSHPLVTHS